MNPSCFFPALQDKPWYYVQRPMTLTKDSKPLGTIIVCHCVYRKLTVAAKENPEQQADADVIGVTLNYQQLSTTNIHNDQIMKVQLGIGQCPYCECILWTCSDVETLIKICEQLGID